MVRAAAGLGVVGAAALGRLDDEGDDDTDDQADQEADEAPGQRVRTGLDDRIGAVLDDDGLERRRAGALLHARADDLVAEDGDGRVGQPGGAVRVVPGGCDLDDRGAQRDARVDAPGQLGDGLTQAEAGVDLVEDDARGGQGRVGVHRLGDRRGDRRLVVLLGPLVGVGHADEHRGRRGVAGGGQRGPAGAAEQADDRDDEHDGPVRPDCSEGS